MAASLPPVSAKLVADAEQFIAEFRRAERAAQGTSSKVSAEVDKLSRSLEKKFSLSDIGKSLLSGFGLGSGFAVLNTTMGLVTQAFEEHKAKLVEIDNIWLSINAKSKEYQLSLLGPKEQVGALEKELAGLQEQYLELVKPKVIEFQTFTPDGQVTTGKSISKFGTTDDMLQVAKNLQEQHDIGKKLEELRKRMADDAHKASDQTKQDLLEISKLHNQTWASMEKNYQAMLADMPEHDFIARRDAIEDMFYTGKIGAEAASKAIKELDADQERWTANATKAAEENMKIWAEFFDTVSDAGVTQALENNREYAKDMKDSMVYFADGVESFLDDAIARGKDFGDVISDLGNSIVSTFLKLSVVNPLMNSIFGGAKGWTALPTLFGFADGGRPPVGRASLVGERGPELFIPDTAGTVVPNHELGGGGDSFSFTYNFASGVQRSEIMPMLKMQERSIISRIVDAQRRGKQLSPAY